MIYKVTIFALGQKEAEEQEKGGGKPRPYIYKTYLHFVYKGERVPLVLVQYIFL